MINAAQTPIFLTNFPKIMKKYDVAFSFDTTGSMSACLGQVRRQIKQVAADLIDQIPGMRISIIAHGDYCDEKVTYLMQHIDFTTDKKKIIDFVTNVGSTGGGDAPEAYEYVLREAQKLSWDSESCRALVMIGDDIPHPADKNPYKIDWRKEVKELFSMGVNIYSVQCLNRGNGAIKTFWRQMSEFSNGYHLYLDQFSSIVQMMTAICYKQVGNNELEQYQERLTNELGGMTIALKQMFDVMLGRKKVDEIEEENNKRYDWADHGGAHIGGGVVKKIHKAREGKEIVIVDDGTDLRPCRPARFQVCKVDNDVSIKQFAVENGLEFKVGRGFYEFTKSEVISKKKEIVLQKLDTGEIFEGVKARRILNLIDYNEKAKVPLTKVNEYRVFIQSTSYNRKLEGDTNFLYEVDFGPKV